MDVSRAPKVKDYFAKKGFDPLPGARPMLRLIQDTVCKALADELLLGRLAGGGKITVDVEGEDKIQLIFADEAAKEASVT